MRPQVSCLTGRQVGCCIVALNGPRIIRLTRRDMGMQGFLPAPRLPGSAVPVTLLPRDTPPLDSPQMPLEFTPSGIPPPGILPSVLYMLMEKASGPSILKTKELPGYAALDVTQRQRFGEYVLFQLSFAIHVLGQLWCSHNDLSKARHITANMLYEPINGLDPCSPEPESTCSWGHCWTIKNRTWCFDRATTPLMNFIVKIFDFGTAHCRPSQEQLDW